jgi:hypothetical protein
MNWLLSNGSVKIPWGLVSAALWKLSAIVFVSVEVALNVCRLTPSAAASC